MAKPLSRETKPLFRLLTWLMLMGAICLILKGTGVLMVSQGWLYGFWTAVGMVFLECLRVETVHRNDLPEE
jgi:hypothetical protein